MKLILLFIFFATKLTAQDSLKISGIEAPLPSFSKKFSVDDVQASTDKNDPSTIKINIKGEAKNISFPIKLPFKAEATNPSNNNPLSQAEPSAAVAIEDKDGGVYEVDDKGKTRKIGNKGSELPPAEYKEAARKMNVRLGRATTPKLLFKALASEPLAFDEWQENFKGKSIIEKEYQKIGDNYYVPIKLIPAGMTGKVQVDLNGINKDSVIFKTPNGSIYTLQENNILSIAGAKNGDGIELYAQNKFDSTIIYGKLNIYGYEIKNLKVNLVPVNSTDTIDKEKLENELNKIYYPYGVSVKINVESAIMDSSWDINGDNKLAIGETKLMSRYTDEMSYLNSLYEGVDNQIVTLFYLPQGGSDASVFGDMPIKSQYGYLFQNGLNAETIAHELLHGYFQLNHTFDNSIGLAEGSSDNLMDYPVKNKLYKYQWDLVHDRGLKIFSFLQDTSAGRQRLSNNFNFEKGLNVDFYNVGNKDSYSKRAFLEILATNEGFNYLSKFASKNQTIYGYTFIKDGEYFLKGIDIKFCNTPMSNEDILNGEAGEFSRGEKFQEEVNGRLKLIVNLSYFLKTSKLTSVLESRYQQALSINDIKSIDNILLISKVQTLIHETFIHINNAVMQKLNIPYTKYTSLGYNTDHYTEYKNNINQAKTLFNTEGYRMIKKISNKINLKLTNSIIWDSMWDFQF